MILKLNILAHIWVYWSDDDNDNDNVVDGNDDDDNADIQSSGTQNTDEVMHEPAVLSLAGLSTVQRKIEKSFVFLRQTSNNDN